jgi:hypothetical protein
MDVIPQSNGGSKVTDTNVSGVKEEYTLSADGDMTSYKRVSLTGSTQSRDVTNRTASVTHVTGTTDTVDKDGKITTAYGGVSSVPLFLCRIV